MKFALMRAEKANFPLSLMCRMLEVSRSGFYAWLSRPLAKRLCEERRLVVHIHDVFASSKARYGSPRVHAELHARGLAVGRHRVARLMRRERLRARAQRRFIHTTDSRHDHPVAPNLVERRFQAEAPNRLWAGDITYIPTEQGWLFLAVLIDLFSRRVVGWGMSRRIDTQLVLATLSMAVDARQPSPGLVHHSDRGVQYASREYRAALEEHGIVCSMSRVGDCWDNAVVESFFSSLKTELMTDGSFKTIEEARTKLFEYLEVFYNRRRLHSVLGYRSPEAFEERAA